MNFIQLKRFQARQLEHVRKYHIIAYVNISINHSGIKRNNLPKCYTYNNRTPYPSDPVENSKLAGENHQASLSTGVV